MQAQSSVPSTGSGDIAGAFTQIMSSLEDLARNCRDQGMDLMTVMATVMSGAAPQAVPHVSATPADDEIIQRSHELLCALDRADVFAVEPALAPGFIHFVSGPPKDRVEVLSTLAQRPSKVPYIAKRTWDHESVVRKDDALVFTGKAHEIQGGNDTHGGYLYEGWYLLQWVRCGETWRVQLMTWQRELKDRDHWNDVFHRARGFSLEPNGLLVETVTCEKPGTALELAMGQGRNALYLASQGWKVTGVDISDEGSRIAREHAAERGLELETITADLDAWDFGVDRFDLVTLIYAGDHARWIDKIKASLREGGLFILEGWAKETPNDPVGFGEGQLATLFEGFEILRDERVDDVPDWAWDKGKLVRFVARKR